MYIKLLKNLMIKRRKKQVFNNKQISIGKGTHLRNSFSFDIRSNQNKECIKIGEECLIGGNFIIDRNQAKIAIGSRVSIQEGTSLISADRITIGDDVIISWGVTIYDNNGHSIHWEDRKKDVRNARLVFEGKKEREICWDKIKTVPIVIGDKVWIGFGVSILKGVHIGEGAVIAARSVVVKDIPPYAVAAGNPAQIVKYIEH